jgi:superfamily II DNA or RNA helicase
MAKRKMHTLYFVRFESKNDAHGVKFLFTAVGPQDAEAKGRECINPDYVNEYKLTRVEIVCQTPDEVLFFEPV